jgi:hypothetical protein
MNQIEINKDHQDNQIDKSSDNMHDHELAMR